MSNDRRILTELAAQLGSLPTQLAVAKALNAFASLDAEAAGLTELCLGMVSSFTSDFLLKPLQARGYCDGFRLDLYNGPYGQYIQELMDAGSGLHRRRPQVVVLAVRLEDACPELYGGFNTLSAERIVQILGPWQEQLERALRIFREHSQALVFVTNFEQPAFPSMGLADRRSRPSQTAVIAEANAWLEALARRLANVYVLDIDALSARCGRQRWSDPKLRLLARLPVAPEFHWAYAGEITRMLRATSGKTRKVLAIDCDNTLWGGVLGDVGLEAIALGSDYPGSAFVAFQRRALALHQRGVALVVASKNDPQAVREVFEKHPEMVLRPQHIAYFGVSWEPKPDSLRQAAAILNLGLDSFVFIDDQPVECAMMRELLPEVLTVQLPEDPAYYESTLAQLDCFDQLTVSDEDRARGAMYRQEAARAQLKVEAKDLESFYAGLQMEMWPACNESAHVARAAQLTQRTNQFNMTTIRRTESDLAALMQSGRAEVLTLRLTDRFGDHGIVGLAIVMTGADEWLLDTFLMSCRVLGRTVEQTFMAYIARRAMAAGAGRLCGLYAQTKKNTQFRDFYRNWGMKLEGADADGRERWVYALSAGAAAMIIPPWMRLRTAGDDKEQP